MAEATDWLFDLVDQMDLKNKDIFIVIGASRTGKGTLLRALNGIPLKLFHQNE